MNEEDQGPPSDIFQIASRPGVKRDGTSFDSDYYQDGQWMRFQRGRPRKIGGFRAITDQLTGPMREVYVDSRAYTNTAHVFSPFGVQQLTFDNTGIGAGLADRTPAGFVPAVNYSWQVDSMFQSGGGGLPVLVCANTPDMDGIASDATGGVYSGDITGTGALTAIADGGGPIAVSGGCVVLQPFLFVYGSNGLIRNSNPNDFSAATGWSAGAGLANTANVAGTKIVRGLPTRGGGASPAGLFWALDALIRVTFTGVAPTIWKYDTISTDVTVLSKHGIVEYDGVYFWPGVDRFYVYTGVVQELPNDMNLNYFFDNLNFAQRQKVWAMKVQRFGEIWWFFPSGSNTECDSVIIFNVREKTWYDTRCSRTFGYPARVFSYPVMGGDPTSTILLKYTVGVGAFANGNTVTGGTSGAVGTVRRALPGSINLVNVTGNFVNGETISSSGGAATGTVNATPVSQDLVILWQHEYGVDRVYGQDVQAIESYYETSNFQFMTGGPGAEESSLQGPDIQSRVAKVEPDFVMNGTVNMQVVGREYAQSPDVLSQNYPITGTTPFVSLREMRREAALRFTSNEAGGNYQAGRILVKVEPGDVRG